MVGWISKNKELDFENKLIHPQKIWKKSILFRQESDENFSLAWFGEKTTLVCTKSHIDFFF